MRSGHRRHVRRPPLALCTRDAVAHQLHTSLRSHPFARSYQSKCLGALQWSECEVGLCERVDDDRTHFCRTHKSKAKKELATKYTIKIV